MPGPAPNRSTDLSRERDAQRGDRAPIKTGTLRPVTIPRYQADWDWHPIAKRMFDALRSSGQSAYFQDTDWAFAIAILDDLSEYKKTKNRSAVMLSSLLSGLERLLVTEADRRRARIELEAPEEPQDDEAVTAIGDYRARLGVVQ